MTGQGWIWLLLLLTLVGGCTDPGGTDPVVQALTSRDSFLERMERLVRPHSYWSRKVAELEKGVETARNGFQARHDAYRSSLLARREAVIQAVQEAKQRHSPTDEARQEAIQHHRTALAHNRDAARDAGRHLRIRLALLRKAQEQRDRSR
ncbi:MAG: hypothetical protein G8237_14530 [Magnetococcales bacterium]|nr:hypothetical protein [Magnetococcales bacterium]NGZ07560.1 hypothetical protein [Magnetococcales bacterium]